MPAAFEHRPATPPQQCGERIEFVKSRGQFASNFSLIGLKRRCRAGLFGKDHGGLPCVVDARVQFQARAEGRGGILHADPYVFRAVAQQRAVAQRQSSTLLEADATQRWTLWAE